jgi:hypothetical protein
MKISKAGKALDPEIKKACDKIYLKDPMRYTAIARWVWWAQKQGWSDEAITECFKMAEPSIHAATNWWAYLTRLLPKAKAQATEQESSRHKTEVGMIANEFMEFLKTRTK